MVLHIKKRIVVSIRKSTIRLILVLYFILLFPLLHIWETGGTGSRINIVKRHIRWKNWKARIEPLCYRKTRRYEYEFRKCQDELKTEEGTLKVYGSLLDTLAIKMGFDYLSNLRRLDGYKKIQLRNLIKSIPANAFSEWEWKDALQYLTGTTFIQDMYSAYDVRQDCWQH